MYRLFRFSRMREECNSSRAVKSLIGFKLVSLHSKIWCGFSTCISYVNYYRKSLNPYLAGVGFYSPAWALVHNDTRCPHLCGMFHHASLNTGHHRTGTVPVLFSVRTWRHWAVCLTPQITWHVQYNNKLRSRRSSSVLNTNGPSDFFCRPAVARIAMTQILVQCSLQGTQPLCNTNLPSLYNSTNK